MSMTTEERLAWAVGRLDNYLTDWNRVEFFDRWAGMEEAVRALADCECRTKHVCCLDNEDEDGPSECIWTPCQDCAYYLNGDTYQKSIFALSDEAEMYLELVLPEVA